jgi:hypothetical protein
MGHESEAVILAGAIVLGLTVFVLIPLVVVMSWRERLARPGLELAWTPVSVGTPFTLAFTAGAARYHALWLNLDVAFTSERREYWVITSWQLEGDRGTRAGGRAGTAWELFSGTGFTSKTTWQINGTAPATARAPYSKWEIDRSIAWDGRALAPGMRARYRALSLVGQLGSLPTGERCTISATIEPIDFDGAFAGNASVATG